MKKAMAFLCTVLLTLALGTPAFAEENTLTLSGSVPEEHTVAIEDNGGLVVADGIICGKSVLVERHKEQIYWVLPVEGKTLEILHYDGEDVTVQVDNGVFTAPALVRNAKLEAVFKDAAAAPDDKLYDVSGTAMNANGDPIPGAAVVLGGKTDVTDENGKFEIEDVPSGPHPVLITEEDGKVIGHAEITIQKADDKELTLTVDESGNPVIKPSAGTKDIDLALELSKGGRIAVKDAKDVTPAKSDTFPKTGDNGLPILPFLVLMVVSGTALMVTIKKRKSRV